MSSGFIWLAASTGLISLLTPCVFPMVPVTIAYFSSAEHRRAPGVKGAILFGAGIVSKFLADMFMQFLIQRATRVSRGHGYSPLILLRQRYYEFKYSDGLMRSQSNSLLNDWRIRYYTRP
jgi:hypothetical protein